jgi:FkbM family methyltransferase
MKLKQTKLYWKLQRRLRKKNICKSGYGQYGQDAVAFQLLKDVKKGIFVDIGANDGVTFSNSLLFEEAGWSGICVEPHPIIFEALKEKRRCNLVNACISDENKMVDFLVVEGGANMLSGIMEFLDQRNLDRIDREIKDAGGNKKIIPIESISSTSLLNRFNYDHIDFLSVDTEGCELLILKSINLKKIPVTVISVENGSRSPEIFNYLNKIGYDLFKCVGCDEIYISNELQSKLESQDMLK